LRAAVVTDRGDQFRVVLELLSRLQNNPDVLFLAMSPPFAVRFEVEQTAIDRELAELRLSEEDFRREARVIGNMLLAILSHEDDAYIEHMAKEHDHPDDPSYREELVTRVSAVRDAFATDHVVKRFEVKRYSKAPSFASVDWDVKLKVADANLTDWSKFPYATVRLTYQREFDDTPYAFLGKPFDALQINFSVDEVAHLIRVFLQIQTALERTEEELQ
jgi:hypothetical protein